MSFITKSADDLHVGLTVLRTLHVYVEFAVRPLKMFDVCQLVPLMLYSRSGPSGDFTDSSPVVTVQFGCNRFAWGCAGGSGIFLITKLADDMHEGSNRLRALIV